MEAVECGGCRGGGGDSVVVPPGGLLGVGPFKPPLLLAGLANSPGVSIRGEFSGELFVLAPGGYLPSLPAPKTPNPKKV